MNRSRLLHGVLVLSLVGAPGVGPIVPAAAQSRIELAERDVELTADLTDVPAPSRVDLAHVPGDALAGAPSATSDEGGLAATPIRSIDLAASPIRSIPIRSIPIRSIPIRSIGLLDTVGLDGMTLDQVGIVGGWAPILAGSALEHRPLHTVTWKDLVEDRVAVAALEDRQLGDLDIASTPIRSIPIASIVLGTLPIRSIPLDPSTEGDEAATLAAWCQALDSIGWPCAELGIDPAIPSTADDHSLMALAIAGVPIRSIPIRSIPIRSIDISALPIRSIPIRSIELESSPLASIPIRSIDLAATPIASIPIRSIPIRSIPLMVSFLASTPIRSIDVAASPIRSIPIRSIPADTREQVIDCSTGIDCNDTSPHTLGDADGLGAILEGATLEHLGPALTGLRLADVWLYLTEAERARIQQLLQDPALTVASIDPADDLTLGELGAWGDTTIEQLLAALPAEILDTLTLDDLLAGLFAHGEYPWSDLDLDTFALHQHAADGVRITYTAAFGPVGSPELRAEVDLPDGFAYVPGSARSDELTVPVEPVATDGVLTWEFARSEVDESEGLDPSQPFAISFAVVPGPTASTATTSLVATSPDWGEDTSTAAVTVRVHESLEPNDTPDQAVPAMPDDLFVTTLADGADVDLYTIDAAAGERLAIDLSNLDADYDLVLYGPPPAPVGPPSSPKDPGAAPRADLPVLDQGYDAIDPGQQLDAQPLDDLRLLDGLSVVATSTKRQERGADVDERIDTPPLPRGGTYMVQVVSYNGAWSPRPYALRVQARPAPALPPCDPRVPPFAGEGAEGRTVLDPDMTTLFVVNERRFGDTHGRDEQASLRMELERFVGSGSEGALLEFPAGILAVETITEVARAYEGWDQDRCNPRRADAAARAIAAEVAAIRTQYPRLANVVLVGGDEIVPFGRVPDRTSLSNEFSHAPSFPVNDETIGSLGAGFVLTDDVYGDDDPMRLGNEHLFVPEVAVGRLVETPEQIVKTLDNFLFFGGQLAADTTAMVSGYDFLTDGAHAVSDALELAQDTSPRGVTELISETWTATDLGNALLEPTRTVNSVNAHFDHYRALPASENLAGTEADLFTVDDVVDGTVGVDQFERTVLFSMGCHSGLSISDIQIGGSGGAGEVDVEGLKRDWAQVLAGEGIGGFVGNTGYGYGDTDLVAYSEQLMVEVAQRLDGAYTIGEALAFAKQRFTAELGVFSPYEEKASMEATLYGLPMWHLPRAGRPAEPPTSSVTLGPRADVTTGTLPLIVAGPGDQLLPVTTGNGTYYHYEGQTTQSPLRPAQPRYDEELTQSDLVAKGAWLTHLETSNAAGTALDPVLSRPVVSESTDEPEPDIGSVAYPGEFLRVADFQDHTGPRQQLQLTLGHFQGERGLGPTGEVTGLQRLLTRTGVEVFYVDPTNPTAMADTTAPQVLTATAVDAGGAIDFTVDAADDVAVDAVRLFWIADDTAGTWNRVDLTQGSGSLWTGTHATTVPADVDWFVQVRDVHGNVGTSSNKGWFHGLTDRPTPAAPDLPVDLRFDGRRLDGRWFAGPVTVTGGPDGIHTNHEDIIVRVDGREVAPLAEGTVVDGEGIHLVELVDGPTGTVLMRTHLRIDTVAPTVDFVDPAPDAQVPLGAVITPTVACTDVGAGVATCDPGSIDTATEGTKALTVTTTDRLGHSTTASMTYTVVEPPPPGIHGTVDNAASSGSSGVPLVGACVDAFDDTGAPVASVVTDGDGAFLFDGLAAGSYTVRVSGCAAGPYVPQWYGDAPGGDSPVAVTLSTGGSVPLGAFHLPPGVEVADAGSTTEGDTGTQMMSFAVTVGRPDPALTDPITVDWSLAGTATSGEDVEAAGGMLSFPVAGPYTQLVDVTVLGDDVLEPDETVQVVLGAATGATVLRTPGQGTIIDDEFAVDDATTTPQNQVVEVDVLANDRRPGQLTVVGVSTPTHGSTAHLGDGRVQYTPPTGFAGTDVFTYTVEASDGAVEQAQVEVTVTAVVPPAPVSDFTGDGVSDRAVHLPRKARWWIEGVARNLGFGEPGDLAVPGDYDGDRRVDVAVFRPGTGQWLVQGDRPRILGRAGDIPVPADWDGDGDTDPAVFRPSSGTWHLTGGQVVRWGTVAGDIPVPADYDGDGDADIAIFRPQIGRWLVLDQTSPYWGQAGDVPVPADYDGDGDADMAVFRPSTGTWLVSGRPSVDHGRSGDVPVPGDFDGDGLADVAVYRPRNGQWLVSGQPATSWASGGVPLSAPLHLVASMSSSG